MTDALILEVDDVLALLGVTRGELAILDEVLRPQVVVIRVYDPARVEAVRAERERVVRVVDAPALVVPAEKIHRVPPQYHLPRPVRFDWAWRPSRAK